ncbi:MAG: SGNH/GDSL hydrolase family protein [Rhodovulum sp.]
MKHFALVAALMAAPLPATAASLDSFSDIFVFGDSLSDPGNLFNALTGTPSSPVSPLYPNGQITDGDTWASQIGADFDSGRNFAFAAARAAPRDPIEFAFPDLSPPDPSDEVSLGTLNVPDFGEQIALYQDAGPTLGPTPLAAIWFGGNDLRDAFAAPDEATAQAIITAAITSIVGGAAALAGEGFSTIAVFGAPNLGRIPEVLARGPDAALAAANVSALFNDTLRTALAPLSATTDIAYVDIFGLFEEVAATPGAYGFTDIRTPCLEDLLIGATAECSSYLFYDDIHPTAAGHALIAERFADSVPPVPLPAGGGLMLAGLGVLAAVRRRRTPDMSLSA